MIRHKRREAEKSSEYIPVQGEHCWHKERSNVWVIPYADIGVQTCCRCGSKVKDVCKPIPGHGPHAPRALLDGEV